MSNIEMLKKYKELLDSGIITQEEFNKKKEEILFSAANEAEPAEVKEEAAPMEAPKKKTGNKSVKWIIIALVAVLALAAGFMVIKTNLDNNAKDKQINIRAEALKEKIAPIMEEYHINTYDVRMVDGDYEVFAEGFERLKNKEALALLKELDYVSIEDPCGDGYIDFGTMTHVHPGLDDDYSYWRVSSSTSRLSQKAGGGYRVPGIYSNQLINTVCVYECDN